MTDTTDGAVQGVPKMTADAERIAAQVLGQDVGTDPFGQLILIPNEPVLAAGVNTFTDIKAQLCK